VQDVEEADEFVLDGEAGAEDGGAGYREPEFGREGVEDVEEVEGAEDFGGAPGVAAWEVEAGVGGGFAHGLVGGEGGPLEEGELVVDGCVRFRGL